MMLFRPDGFIPAARSKQVKKAEQQVLQSQEEILAEHPVLRVEGPEGVEV
jgi:hypothetical protein